MNIYLLEKSSRVQDSRRAERNKKTIKIERKQIFCVYTSTYVHKSEEIQRIEVGETIIVSRSRCRSNSFCRSGSILCRCTLIDGELLVELVFELVEMFRAVHIVVVVVVGRRIDMQCSSFGITWYDEIIVVIGGRHRIVLFDLLESIESNDSDGSSSDKRAR